MMTLTSRQCRVLGVMLEKEITTPDQYPLSLNALTTGCNQKSNREPVMSLTEAEAQDIVDELMEMKLVSDQGAFSSRVVKYQHRFCNTEFGSLQLSKQQLAIICVLFLRGHQTPGELRTRTNRLAEFSNVAEVEQVLNQLTDLNGEKLVVKLEREPGKRDSRYAQLFSELTEQTAAPGAGENDGVSTGNSDTLARIETLELEVSDLKQELSRLHQLVQQLGG
ncbi:YceH family protein [Thalassomonas haliotis]|uniref:YceH family protein n=1 Tax=Thalassomonas haliotis TaxID=485448 RepID=A0ABY7VIQ4_9GAMM|nr:DUF480 domain-containing protein [Thalassomonas haliotis]WDE13456.1 YceH family protein [Thalassomonas haliotis]